MDNQPTTSGNYIIRNLYMDDETADVRFIFDVNSQEQFVPAHKKILASASPVFRSMFYGKLKEEGNINIVDASPLNFKEFLKMFYQHEPTITRENVEEITNLANKYNLEDGLKICEKFFVDNTGLKDLCPHLVLAIQFNLRNLENYCKENIASNPCELLATDNFVNSSIEVLKIILNIVNLNCLDLDVFNACKVWAQHSCQRNGKDINEKQNLRAELGECFYMIPFTRMKVEIFSNIVFANRELFSLDEIVDIFAFIATGEATEITKKYNYYSVRKFDWSEKYWVCGRVLEDKDNYIIYRNEYTSFTSTHKLLFGRFEVLPIQSSSKRKGLVVNISITKQLGTMEEIIDRMQNVIPVESTLPLAIQLNKPIVIIPHVKYSICMDFSNNDTNDVKYVQNWSTDGGKFTSTSVKHGNICVNFHKHPNSICTADYSVVSKLHFNLL